VTDWLNTPAEFTFGDRITANQRAGMTD